MKLERLMALVVSIALTSASYPSVHVAAQAAQPVVPSQQAIQATGLTISGTVMRSDRKTPIANACLRLRKMDSDTIVGRSMSDKNGAFSFSVSEPGMYLVEVVHCGDEGVMAVSDALAVAAAPLTIAVVVPTTLAAAVFSSTAFLVLSAASAAGITAAAINRGQDGDSDGVLSPEQ